MIEVLNFIESATYYIRSAFRNNPPSMSSYIHLLPLIDSTWWQSLEAAGIREKSLPEIMEIIKVEAESRNPLHARRIQILKVRNTSSHRDFLQLQERSMEVCEWKKMTPDQFLIHLFAEASNQYMSKLAMEILSGPMPSVAILRAKVAETENSLWYNAGRHQGKFAGAGGGIPPPPSGETRFFNPCNSKTHWESACWPRGPCSKCGKHGHRAEWCQNDPVSPPDLEQAKAAGENLKCYLSSIKTTKTR